MINTAKDEDATDGTPVIQQNMPMDIIYRIRLPSLMPNVINVDMGLNQIL